MTFSESIKWSGNAADPPELGNTELYGHSPMCLRGVVLNRSRSD